MLSTILLQCIVTNNFKSSKKSLEISTKSATTRPFASDAFLMPAKFSLSDVFPSSGASHSGVPAAYQVIITRSKQ